MSQVCRSVTRVSNDRIPDARRLMSAAFSALDALLFSKTIILERPSKWALDIFESRGRWIWIPSSSLKTPGSGSSRPEVY